MSVILPNSTFRRLEPDEAPDQHEPGAIPFAIAPPNPPDIPRSLLHARFGLATAILVLVAMLVAALLQATLYRAESHISVDPVSHARLETATSDSYMAAQQQVVIAPETLATALTRLNTGVWSRKDENEISAIARLAQAIQTARLGRQLSIAFIGPSPVQDAVIVNAVTGAYLQRGRRDALVHNDQTLIEEERDRLQKTLTSDRAEQVRLTTVGAAPPAGQPVPEDAALTQARQRLEETRQAEDQAAARLSLVSSSGVNNSPELQAEIQNLIDHDPGLSGMQSTINQRRDELTGQMAGLSSNTAAYRQAAAELAQLDQTLQSTTAQLRDKAALQFEQRLRTELARTGDAEARANAELARLTAATSAEGPRQQRLDDLAQEITHTENRLKALNNTLEQRQLHTAAPAHLIAAATIPAVPEPSNRETLLLLALPIAILCGVLTILIATRVDPPDYITHPQRSPESEQQANQAPAHITGLERYILAFAQFVERLLWLGDSRRLAVRLAIPHIDPSLEPVSSPRFRFNFEEVKDRIPNLPNFPLTHLKSREVAPVTNQPAISSAESLTVTPMLHTVSEQEPVPEVQVLQVPEPPTLDQIPDPEIPAVQIPEEAMMEKFGSETIEGEPQLPLSQSLAEESETASAPFHDLRAIPIDPQEIGHQSIASDAAEPLAPIVHSDQPLPRREPEEPRRNWFQRLFARESHESYRLTPDVQPRVEPEIPDPIAARRFSTTTTPAAAARLALGAVVEPEISLASFRRRARNLSPSDQPSATLAPNADSYSYSDTPEPDSPMEEYLSRDWATQPPITEPTAPEAPEPHAMTAFSDLVARVAAFETASITPPQPAPIQHIPAPEAPYVQAPDAAVPAAIEPTDRPIESVSTYDLAHAADFEADLVPETSITEPVDAAPVALESSPMPQTLPPSTLPRPLTYLELSSQGSTPDPRPAAPNEPEEFSTLAPVLDASFETSQDPGPEHLLGTPFETEFSSTEPEATFHAVSRDAGLEPDHSIPSPPGYYVEDSSVVGAESTLIAPEIGTSIHAHVTTAPSELGPAGIEGVASERETIFPPAESTESVAANAMAQELSVPESIAVQAIADETSPAVPLALAEEQPEEQPVETTSVEPAAPIPPPAQPPKRGFSRWAAQDQDASSMVTPPSTPEPRPEPVRDRIAAPEFDIPVPPRTRYDRPIDPPALRPYARHFEAPAPAPTESFRPHPVSTPKPETDALPSRRRWELLSRFDRPAPSGETHPGE